MKPKIDGLQWKILLNWKILGVTKRLQHHFSMTMTWTAWTHPARWQGDGPTARYGLGHFPSLLFPAAGATLGRPKPELMGWKA